MDRDIIPFLGQKTSRERLKELDENRTSIWVALGVVSSKTIEAYAGIPMQMFPIEKWGIDFTDSVWWTIFQILVIVVIIREIDKKVTGKAEDVGEKAEDVKDKADDMKEQAEEKLDEVTDSESD